MESQVGIDLMTSLVEEVSHFLLDDLAGVDLPPFARLHRWRLVDLIDCIHCCWTGKVTGSISRLLVNPNGWCDRGNDDVSLNQSVDSQLLASPKSSSTGVSARPAALSRHSVKYTSTDSLSAISERSAGAGSECRRPSSSDGSGEDVLVVSINSDCGIRETNDVLHLNGVGGSTGKMNGLPCSRGKYSTLCAKDNTVDRGQSGESETSTAPIPPPQLSRPSTPLDISRVPSDLPSPTDSLFSSTFGSNTSRDSLPSKDRLQTENPSSCRLPVTSRISRYSPSLLHWLLQPSGPPQLSAGCDITVHDLGMVDWQGKVIDSHGNSLVVMVMDAVMGVFSGTGSSCKNGTGECLQKVEPASDRLQSWPLQKTELILFLPSCDVTRPSSDSISVSDISSRFTFQTSDIRDNIGLLSLLTEASLSDSKTILKAAWDQLHKHPHAGGGKNCSDVCESQPSSGSASSVLSRKNKSKTSNNGNPSRVAVQKRPQKTRMNSVTHGDGPQSIPINQSIHKLNPHLSGSYIRRSQSMADCSRITEDRRSGVLHYGPAMGDIREANMISSATKSVSVRDLNHSIDTKHLDSPRDSEFKSVKSKSKKISRSKSLHGLPTLLTSHGNGSATPSKVSRRGSISLGSRLIRIASRLFLRSKSGDSAEENSKELLTPREELFRSNGDGADSSPVQVPGPVRQGVLLRRFRFKWRRVHVSLAADGTLSGTSFVRAPGDADFVISMAHASLERLSESNARKPFAFKLQSVVGPSRASVHLCANSKEELDAWCSVLVTHKEDTCVIGDGVHRTAKPLALAELRNMKKQVSAPERLAHSSQSGSSPTDGGFLSGPEHSCYMGAEYDGVSFSSDEYGSVGEGVRSSSLDHRECSGVSRGSSDNRECSGTSRGSSDTTSECSSRAGAGLFSLPQTNEHVDTSFHLNSIESRSSQPNALLDRQNNRENLEKKKKEGVPPVQHQQDNLSYAARKGILRNLLSEKEKLATLHQLHQLSLPQPSVEEPRSPTHKNSLLYGRRGDRKWTDRLYSSTTQLAAPHKADSILSPYKAGSILSQYKDGSTLSLQGSEEGQGIINL